MRAAPEDDGGWEEESTDSNWGEPEVRPLVGRTRAPARSGSAEWRRARQLALGALCALVSLLWLAMRLRPSPATLDPPTMAPRRPYLTECPSLSVWQRGLMRSCCDVFPTRFYHLLHGNGSRARGEHSTVDWATVPIRDRSIVYVPSLDVPAFLRRFAALPASARLTLVSGGEDVGMPRELFGLGRVRRMVAELPFGLGELLGDARLLHWWVQNYDLWGCNEYSNCSRLTARNWWHSRRVSPLPIGLDLHTRAEKAAVRSSACAQQGELERIRAALPPWRARPASMLAPFSCARKDRAKVCRALERGESAGKVAFFSGERGAMWRATGLHAFVAAPYGHGVDTHRVWEALALGAVPVVVATSLDALYDNFPVVRIERWEDVSAEAMVEWRAQIVRRFGDEPFSARVRAALTNAHWAGKIAERHAADLARLPAASARAESLAPPPLLPTVVSDGWDPAEQAGELVVSEARRRRLRPAGLPAAGVTTSPWP